MSATAMMISKSDLHDLTYDGDTLELEDGRTLRLRIEPDDVNPFEDNPEFYGRIGCSRRNEDTGRFERPSDFDGAAEKLNVYNDVIWWQPPADVVPLRNSDPDAFRKFRSLIRDLASWGSHCVRVEVLEGEDAYHRPIVVAFEVLGGVDSVEDGYLHEVVGELVAELGFDVEDR